MSTSITTLTVNLRDLPWESVWLFSLHQLRDAFFSRPLFSLRRSCCYSSWLKLSRSLCLHSYFISNSNTAFFHKLEQQNKLMLTSVMRTWCVDDFNDKLIAAGWIRHIRGMSPGSATLSPPQTTSWLTSFASFFFCPHRFFAWSQHHYGQCGFISWNLGNVLDIFHFWFITSTKRLQVWWNFGLCCFF